jgi:hypothetical protein
MKWYQSRLFNYVIFGTTYLIMKEIAGFEFAVLVALGTIVGEQTVVYFKQQNKDKMNK